MANRSMHLHFPVSRSCTVRDVRDAAHPPRSNGHDLKQIRKAREITRISCIKRQARGDGRRRDEQGKCAAAARLAARSCDGGEHAPVRTSHGGVDWERIECCLGSLQPILTTSAFRWISGRVRPDSQFRHGHSRDGKLGWQLAGIDEFELDHDRGVDKSSRMTFVNHAGRDLGRRRRPCPSEAAGCPHEGRP